MDSIKELFTDGALHKYNDNCLTEKPYGIPGTSNMNKYWQDRVKNWGIEYSLERVRGNIDTVRSSNESYSLEQPAEITQSRLDLGYYHNPESYCKKNPEKYPCVNHWLSKKPGFKDFKGNKVYNTEDMYVPGMKENHTDTYRDIDIDDNYHTRSKEMC